jgi:hypothetical protein
MPNIRSNNGGNTYKGNNRGNTYKGKKLTRRVKKSSKIHENTYKRNSHKNTYKGKKLVNSNNPKSNNGALNAIFPNSVVFT